MATVSETLPIVAELAGFKPATVTWVARRLVESGDLPRSVGARVPQINHRDLARLLIGLLCGAHGGRIVQATRQYSGLLAGPAGRGHPNALDWMTDLIDSLAHRDADPEAARDAYDVQIEIVASWTEIRIKSASDNGSPIVFIEPGTDPRFWQSDKVRRSSTIAGVTISNIVRDLARVPV